MDRIQAAFDAMDGERGSAIAEAALDDEPRSWPAVWWAFGVLHFLYDEDLLLRARDLLRAVDSSPAARSAALGLLWRIDERLAEWYGHEIDLGEQVRTLAKAVELAPDWPESHIAYAEAAQDVGDAQTAARHARRALELYERGPDGRNGVSEDFTGFGMNHQSLVREVEAMIARAD